MEEYPVGESGGKAYPEYNINLWRWYKVWDGWIVDKSVYVDKGVKR